MTDPRRVRLQNGEESWWRSTSSSSSLWSSVAFLWGLNVVNDSHSGSQAREGEKCARWKARIESFVLRAGFRFLWTWSAPTVVAALWMMVMWKSEATLHLIFVIVVLVVSKCHQEESAFIHCSWWMVLLFQSVITELYCGWSWRVIPVNGTFSVFHKYRCNHYVSAVKTIVFF